MSDEQKPVKVNGKRKGIQPASNFVIPSYNSKMMVGKRVHLHSFEYKDGQFGEYVDLHCTDVKTNEQLIISSGSQAIMGQVSAIEMSELPMTIKIIGYGNTQAIEEV